MTNNEKNNSGWFGWFWNMVDNCKTKWRKPVTDQEALEDEDNQEASAEEILPASTPSQEAQNLQAKKQDIIAEEDVEEDESNPLKEDGPKDEEASSSVSSASKATSSHVRTVSQEEIEAKTAEIAKAAAASVLLSPTDLDEIPDEDENHASQSTLNSSSLTESPSSNATMPALVAQQSTYDMPDFHEEAPSRQASGEEAPETEQELPREHNDAPNLDANITSPSAYSAPVLLGAAALLVGQVHGHDASAGSSSF